jgi:uncharacterized protein YfaS (alpha-2-macroglobulin family)
MDLNVAIKVEGLNLTLPAQNLILPAGETKIVNWDLKIPHNLSHLGYEVKVTAGDKTMDLLRFDQKVIPAHPVRTLQATLSQLNQPLTLSAKRPEGAVEGRGGLRVELSNSLVDAGLGGVIAYMKDYPYSCFEQTTSKALTLDDETSGQLSGSTRAGQILPHYAAWQHHPKRLCSGDSTGTGLADTF